MNCVNACSNQKYCFMLKPYYTCGHIMCFNSGMAINWCIQCGCKPKILMFPKIYCQIDFVTSYCMYVYELYISL